MEDPTSRFNIYHDGRLLDRNRTNDRFERLGEVHQPPGRKVKRDQPSTRSKLGHEGVGASGIRFFEPWPARPKASN